MDTLWELCQRLYFPRKLTLGPETRRQYGYALNDWGRVLGHTPALADLDDDNLLLWMRHLLDRRPALSPWTINERVGRVKTLWTFLAKRALIRCFCTVPRLPCPEPTPRAWTREQLAALFAACDLEGGRIGPVPARLWWRARGGFHFGTGARKGEGDALRQEWCDLQAACIVVPPLFRKGRKKPGIYSMPPWLVESFAAIWRPERTLVFPWDRGPACYWLRWNRILRNAGLPSGRKSKTQALRITHASWCKKLGGDATKALGHSDPSTTMRFYLDQRFDDPPEPMFDPTEPRS